VELDLRAIKDTLGLDILRAKTPEMARKELWSCLLVYSLLRESMLRMAMKSERSCRSQSLTATLQMTGNLWLANVVQDWGHRVRELLRTHQFSDSEMGPGANGPDEARQASQAATG